MGLSEGVCIMHWEIKMCRIWWAYLLRGVFVAGCYHNFSRFFSWVANIKGHLICFLELLAKYVMGIVGAQLKNILSIFIYAFVPTFLFPKRDHVWLRGARVWKVNEITYCRKIINFHIKWPYYGKIPRQICHFVLVVDYDVIRKEFLKFFLFSILQDVKV